MSNTIPLLFTIDPNENQKGVYLNENKNRAIVSLNQPIDLSKYKNPRLSLQSASFFFTFPNIFENSKFIFSKGDGVLFENITEILVPPGLYSIEGLNEFLSSAVNENQDLQDDFTNLEVYVNGNYNTERVEVTANSTEITNIKQLRIEIDNPEFSKMLGFQSLTFDSSKKLSAPDQAHFNSVNSIVIGTNLLNHSSSLSIFNEKSNVKYLEQINIDASPGKQVLYRSNYPSMYLLNPVMINEIEIYLLDEKLKDVRMTNIYTVYLSITYDI